MDAKTQQAKSWQLVADEHLTRLKREQQKNKTIQADMVELRGYVDDVISQASRDDGVEVTK
jgi:hypothetical protein